MRRLIRQTLTIARRDFLATVFTPTFLLFLFAPLVFMSFGVIGGAGAANFTESGGEKLRLVALVDAQEGAGLVAADTRLRALFRSPEAPPALMVMTPGPEPEAQARALLTQSSGRSTAVLYGPLEQPRILYLEVAQRHADYLAQLAEEALREARAGGPTPLSRPEFRSVAQAGATALGEDQTAFFAVMGLFMVTLMLAGQAVGTMAEERSNKVIEILAAAVPLETVFLGKLIGMFGVAVLFLFFWGGVVINLGNNLPAEMATALSGLGPATGSAFPFLFFGYFAMAYMLLGSVFLAVGAQASSQREIPMLSLPITLFQFAMLALALSGAAHPGSALALAAELFPFSSPFAMAARAASEPDIWPHLAALGWQSLWVAITLSLGASWFRRGVLQSAGPGLRLPWRRRTR